MTNLEKKKELNKLLETNTKLVTSYYSTLEKMGDIKNNYVDYMTTAPINVDKELERLQEADYELCSALLTMILREDHFSNGSFEKRYRQGQVQVIVKRMIELL